MKKKTQKKQLDFDPRKLLKKIHRIMNDQLSEYHATFARLTEELKTHNIFLVDETGLNSEQLYFIRDYFRREVMPLLNPIFLQDNLGPVFLQNDVVYLAVRFKDNEGDYVYALIEVPPTLNRFVKVPSVGDKHYIIMLDDVIKPFLSTLFPREELEGAYSIKVTRDGELHIYDEYSGNLVDKIKKSIVKRNMGVPARFLYDSRMPDDFLRYLKKVLALTEDDLVAGNRYQNFKDFMSFPNPVSPELEYEPLPPTKVPALDRYPSMIAAMKDRDWLLHYPFQSYEYMNRLLWEAAQDPHVTKIRISLYRLAGDRSTIGNALIAAARNGKEVTVFVEVKARFDEENNIYWSNELLKAGAKVLYSIPGLKVHSKICMISRMEGDKQVRYGFFSTGNFNEKTARIYGDVGLFTANQELTHELVNLFAFLRRETDKITPQNLLIAPANMRERFMELIDKEIAFARAGKKASIILKMNSLEDKDMINKLYEANNAGVSIKLIIRSICCLQTGVPGQSENIKAISIVDRFLEHARLFIFHNDGQELVYASSADWMTRNLSHRVEVAFPILDPTLKQEMIDIINIQLADNQKARVINKSQSNKYVKIRKNKPLVRSQYETYRYLQKKYATDTVNGMAKPETQSIPVKEAVKSDSKTVAGL